MFTHFRTKSLLQSSVWLLANTSLRKTILEHHNMVAPPLPLPMGIPGESCINNILVMKRRRVFLLRTSLKASVMEKLLLVQLPGFTIIMLDTLRQDPDLMIP